MAADEIYSDPDQIDDLAKTIENILTMMISNCDALSQQGTLLKSAIEDDDYDVVAQYIEAIKQGIFSCAESAGVVCGKLHQYAELIRQRV